MYSNLKTHKTDYEGETVNVYYTEDGGTIDIKGSKYAHTLYPFPMEWLDMQEVISEIREGAMII